jgi:hypothetical protein
MEFIPVNVDCYSGYKADEYPRKFIWDHIDFEIIGIIDRWYEGYRNSARQTVHYFKVKTELKGCFLLKHEMEKDRWFLVV